jgi:hypothetical protein
MLALMLMASQSSMLQLTGKVPVRDENLVKLGRSPDSGRHG